MSSVQGDAPRSTVVVSASASYPVARHPVNEMLAPIASIRWLEVPFTLPSARDEAKFIEGLRDATGLLLRTGQVNSRILRGCPTLRVIAVHGAGVDQVDLAAATAREVMVTNTPGANAVAVAELTIAFAIALLRRFHRAWRSIVQKGVWDEARFHGDELGGKKWGVVGFGAIGQRVAALARAFGATVIIYDPYIAPLPQPVGIEQVRVLEDLLRTAEIVSVHVPLNSSTFHLFDSRALGLIRRGAIFINTSRGAIVDGKALYEALKTGQLAGAALDVLEDEPPIASDPLLQMENAIVTPHMAGSTAQSLERIATVASRAIRDVLLGRTPAHLVNPAVLANRGLG